MNRSSPPVTFWHSNFRRCTSFSHLERSPTRINITETIEVAYQKKDQPKIISEKTGDFRHIFLDIWVRNKETGKIKNITNSEDLIGEIVKFSGESLEKITDMLYEEL